MPNALWTRNDLLSATGAKLIGEGPDVFAGVSIDSRTVASGDIFVAIKGDRVDGHDYVVSALGGAAAVAIVAHATPEMEAAGQLLVVGGTPLQALEAMAGAARRRSEASIVAVTGSVGKTSTKELLALALNASGATHASLASFNNHWGVPLTLARLPASAKFGVFEIGMNHAGEITPLVGMVKPHVAIVTTIAASHLGHFKSIDDIADAKAEIFTGIEPGGSALISSDTPFFARLAQAATAAGVDRVFAFGGGKDADIRLISQHLLPDKSEVEASVFGAKTKLSLGVPGSHMVSNALAVLGAVVLLGGDLRAGADALESAMPPKGRGVAEEFAIGDGTFLLIDESYNANPASMRAAFDLLRLKPTQGRGCRIAVLGDMFELGETSSALHEDLCKDLSGIEEVYAVGHLMRHLWEKLPAGQRARHADTADALVDVILARVTAGDVVMIKGSNGMRMSSIADALRKNFSRVGPRV
jgi:UDP-N-acetylmuramoyl-tripeptide--D-alanyl-D-alanine ligase